MVSNFRSFHGIFLILWQNFRSMPYAKLKKKFELPKLKWNEQLLRADGFLPVTTSFQSIINLIIIVMYHKGGNEANSQ